MPAISRSFPPSWRAVLLVRLATPLLLATFVATANAHAEGAHSRGAPDGARIELEVAPYVAVGTTGIRTGADALLRLDWAIAGVFEDGNVVTFGPQQRARGGFLGVRFRDEPSFTADVRFVLGQHRYQGVGGDGVHGGVDGSVPFAGLRLVIEAHTEGTVRLSFGAMLFAGDDLQRREESKSYGVAPYNYVASDVVGQLDAGAGLRVGIDLGM